MAATETETQTPPITVRTSIGPSAALLGVRNTMHAYFEVITSATTHITRPPVDLCIVLDRSGSMASDRKIDTAKEAIKGLVCNLSGDDRVALVLYDSVVEVAFGFDKYSLKDQVDVIMQEIDAIRTQGCTNLYDGLVKGRELFNVVTPPTTTTTETTTETSTTTTTPTPTPTSTPTRNKKIFLFSDGLVNVGVTNTATICNYATQVANDGITIDAFGIGSDFNEDLMSQISEYGCGRFLYIEFSKDMTPFVDFALKGILRLIARRAVMTVRGCGCGIVERVYGGDVVQGFQFNDLSSNNSRGMLAEISCSPTGTTSESTDVLIWELKYELPDGTPASQKGSVSIRVTDNADDVTNARNTAVDVALAIRQAIEVDLKVEQLLDQGKRDEAAALKEKYMSDLDGLLSLDPDNIKLKSHVVAQKRSMQELRNKNTSTAVNRKLGKKNMWRAMHDDDEYCMNDWVHEIAHV